MEQLGMKAITKTYLQYGVSESYAKELGEKGISKTTFDNVPNKDLISKFGLKTELVRVVKKLIKRKPIDESVMQKLLEKSNYTCCLCKESKPFIIHHIIEYALTQNNLYSNLAVLCVEHHNQAHTNNRETGTRKITSKQIKATKASWEKEVKRHNKEVAQNFSKYKKQEDSSFRYLKYSTNKSGAHNENIDIKISHNTTFVLKVGLQEIDQEFVVYLSVKTNLNEQKWLAFATVASINNRVYRDSEFVFRVGRVGEKNYKIVENIVDKINESGLTFEGTPTSIDIIRFRAINDSPIDYSYEFINN